MKFCMFFLSVLLVIASGCAVDPSDSHRVNNDELARNVARRIATTTRNIAPRDQIGTRTLTDYQANGFAGYAILNGEVSLSTSGYYTTFTMSDVDIDFHAYNDNGPVIITDGSLIVDCLDDSGGVPTLSYDIEGTVTISGTANGVAVEDTVTLDFELYNDIFSTGGTLINGAGTVFNLPE
jgi:hypothetical protein